MRRVPCVPDSGREVPISRPLAMMDISDRPRTTCLLKPDTEKTAVAFGDELATVFMLEIEAAETQARAERPHLDIVVCMDRSGSMHGEKMKLAKETLTRFFSRTGLKETDSTALVSFDNVVKVELPLISMGASGRQRGERCASELKPGGTTNLSGGLLKSIDLLLTSDQSQTAMEPRTSGQNRKRAVLLFTDGVANCGIQDTSGIVQAVRGVIEGTNTTIFTFGFGSDHNEDMLREVARSAQGSYYYIKQADDIPSAFADCLGGIMSVVAQNATLTIEAAPRGGSLGKVLGHHKVGGGGLAQQVDVELGDLYSQEEKHVLVELKLPKLVEPVLAPTPVVRASLRYFSVAQSRIEEVTTELLITRPNVTPEQPTNTELDEQRNRIRVADAMEEAARRADRGDLPGARALLQRATQSVSTSVSASSSLSVGLQQQLSSLEPCYESDVCYRSIGAKMTKMCSDSHYQQRSNHMNSTMPGAYRSASSAKAALRAEWGIAEQGAAPPAEAIKNRHPGGASSLAPAPVPARPDFDSAPGDDDMPIYRSLSSMPIGYPACHTV
jgi:Mg-chelatase subunit ChlD